MNKISILIPTKERSSIIDIAFRSIINLNEKPDEIVIIEAGNSMDTLNKAKNLFPEDKKIKLKTIFNQGSSRIDNWLSGIKACSNKFVLILCDDDEIQPDIISKFKEAIKKYDNASVYFCKQRVINKANNSDIISMEKWEEGFYREDQLFINLKEKGFPGFPSILFNKELLSINKNALCVFNNGDYICDFFLIIDALLSKGAFYVDYPGSIFYFNSFSQSVTDGLSLFWPDWAINIKRLDDLGRKEITKYFRKRLLKLTIKSSLYLIYKQEFYKVQPSIEKTLKYAKEFKYIRLSFFLYMINSQKSALFLKKIISFYKSFTN